LADTLNLDSLLDTSRGGKGGRNVNTSQDQNLKNLFVADTSFLYRICMYKKIEGIQTSFHGEPGDGLLILEAHYF
jgi:hypothetical protein